MKRIALIAALTASPAYAMTDAEACKTLAGISYYGAQDGLTMSPIIDGVDEILVSVSSIGGSVDEARAWTSAYLAGYASGLVYMTPAEVAEEYFNSCMAEPV